MLHSQVSNARYSVTQMCVLHTYLCTLVWIYKLCPELPIGLTNSIEDAQPQRWVKPSTLNMEAGRTHCDCEKHLPEPQDLPRGCLWPLLFTEDRRMWIQKNSSLIYISFLSNSWWIPKYNLTFALSTEAKDANQEKAICSSENYLLNSCYAPLFWAVGICSCPNGDYIWVGETVTLGVIS